MMTTLDATVYELKGKIQELHKELLHVATTINDIAITNQFISQKEKEKKHLEASIA